MAGVSNVYRVYNYQTSPFMVSQSIGNSSVIGNGLGFGGVKSFAADVLPQLNLNAIQGFEVRLSTSLMQTPIQGILKEPDVVSYVTDNVDKAALKISKHGDPNSRIGQVIDRIESSLFITTESSLSPVQMNLVLPGNGKGASLVISLRDGFSRGAAVRAVKQLSVKAVEKKAEPKRTADPPQAGKNQDAQQRRHLGLDHGTEYEQQLRPLVVPEPVKPVPAGLVGTVLRKAGYKTGVEKAEKREQQIRTTVQQRTGSLEPKDMTQKEFFDYIKAMLKKNGFEPYGNRAHWIDFKNQRKKSLNDVVTDPKKLYKLFIKPKSENFFTVLERVFNALRGEENVYGKFLRNPQIGRSNGRGDDPYGSSHEPTFLLYFYGFDADFEMVRIAELIERQFTPEELIEFGVEEQIRIDWDETTNDDPDGQEVTGYDANKRLVRIKVKRIEVPQRGPSFTAEVTSNSFLFWGQGGFSESEREDIAKQWQYQAALREEKLAEIFNGDNFSKYRGVPESFQSMYEDRKLLERVRNGEILLFTHSTSAANIEVIARSGVIKPGRNGAAGFRYGMNFSYGPDGMITFVMKKEFHEEDELFDGFGIKKSGESNDEFRRRIAHNLVFLSDTPTKDYLKDDGEDDGERWGAGKTVVISLDDYTNTERPVFAVHLPQIDLPNSVPLSEVYAILVPEHVYEQVRDTFLRINPDLAGKIKLVRDTGQTQEEYMEGIENMPKRTRYLWGQHAPIVGFKAAHKIFVEYLRTVIEAAEQ